MIELRDIVCVDFETYTEGKYSLKGLSTWAYVTDPRFDILCVSIAAGLGNIDFYYKGGPPGASLADARARLARAAGAGKVLVAHNLNFEGLILKLRWGVEFERMVDTTGYLRLLGLGASLKNGWRLVGVEKEEAPPFTEEALHAHLDEMAHYNMVDVVLARKLCTTAIGDKRFTELEWYTSQRTTEENLRGLKVDRDLALALAERFGRRREEMLTRLCATYPDFDTGALNSPVKVKRYIKLRFGLVLATLNKKNLDVVRARAGNEELDEFLGARDAVRTLGTWAGNLRRIAEGPGRIFCPLKYYGSHTGRFSATGKEADRINVQNLPRGRDRRLPELAEYRRILIPDEDESWVACDLSTIEPRITALLAGQKNMLEQFRSGADVYIWFGALVFPGVVIVKDGENGHLRDLCKKAVIGLGYGMGLEKFCHEVLVEMPDTDEKLIVQVFRAYRQQFARMTALRKNLFRTFIEAVETGTPGNVGRCRFRRVHDLKGTGAAVEVRLPTGRSLFYRSIIKVREKAIFDGREEWVWGYRYAPRLDLPAVGGAERPKQVRQKIAAPGLVENIVQACARDLLVAQAREVERHAGLRVRFSVHDELVVGTRRCRCPGRDRPLPKGTPPEALHEPSCPWMAAREVVRQEMSQVSCFPKLADLPVGCELGSVRDH